jgi:O-antigen ligase/polysaccharide polymerase Wzy-like membrane protein
VSPQTTSRSDFDLAQSSAAGVIVVALIAVPALFNPRGQDGFAIIKAALIQILGAVAAVCAIVAVWRGGARLRTSRLVAAMAAVAVVWCVATIVGVAPMLSLLAPGARHEGTLVTLSLVAIGLSAATLDRRYADTIVSAAIVGSIGPSIFALGESLAQSAHATTFREVLPPAGGTLGNPVLLAGYLAVVIPITLARALSVSPHWPKDAPPQTINRALTARGLWMTLAVQVAALFVAHARGAWAATLIATLIIAISTRDLTVAKRRRLVWISSAVLAIALACAATIVGVRDGWLPVGRTFRVRVLIWEEVVRLLNARHDRLLTGYGPEMLQSIVGPYHSPELVLLEGGFAVPDRAHNELLDTLVSAGVLGLTAIVTLHLLFWRKLIAQIRATEERSRSWWLAVGLLAAGMAHFVELQTGIATIPSRLVWWSCVGVVAGWHRDDATGPVVEPETDETPLRWVPLGAGAAMAALVFDLWQPGASLSAAGVVVIVVTGAVVLVTRTSARSDLDVDNMAVQVATAGAVVVGMVMVLFLWHAATPPTHSGDSRELVEIANWISHESTVVLLFFVGLGCAAGSAFVRRPQDGRGPRLLTYSAIVATAFLLLPAIAPPARADVLAYIADELQKAQRWAEATALEKQRVELTPESDVAWSALGGVELELARQAADRDRAERFERATAALAEARRRNPFDWSHIRDQASAERVWAAADHAGRTGHLAEADRRFGEATAMAPAFPRLWAEWGNVSAERGDLHNAFAKLERAMTLHGEGDAETVANAILRATGFNLLDDKGRARAAAQLDADGFHNLAALYRR